jgi:sugar/nucleoside kinase (ribokinase family)
MNTLAVIGNISRDLAAYPDGRQFEQLGGAAFYIARAAANAGFDAAPISVIGADLSWISSDPRLANIDLADVKIAAGKSCAFKLAYTTTGELVSIASSFGVAHSLTRHSLDTIGDHSRYHVSCRRPLDARAVLSRLAREQAPFSADFHMASASGLIKATTPFLCHAEIVFVNAAEYAALTRLIDPGSLVTAVVSDGPRPVVVLRHGHPVATVSPARITPVEVTGAGDTLAGTYLARAASGDSPTSALRAAVAAASLAVMEPGLAMQA